MQQDIRHTPLYRDIESIFRAWYQPGTGRCRDAEQVAASPDGHWLGFTGTVFEDLASAPRTELFFLERSTGQLSPGKAAGHNDRCPKWSPTGEQIAFLSDRVQAGTFQLCWQDGVDQAEARSTSPIEGSVEYFDWSPDGRKILLGVAGLGSDLAGCQGGATVGKPQSDLPDWMPELDSGNAENLWRKVWVLDLASGTARNLTEEGINVWECAWQGNDSLLAVASTSHSEGSWYQSRLIRISVPDAAISTLYEPKEQIGLPSANPSGSCCAFIEAVCSDRMIIAGDLKLLDPLCGTITPVNTSGVDVTHLAWRNDKELVFTGHRGFATVIGEVQVDKGIVKFSWVDEQRTIGGWYPSSVPLVDGGVAVLIESFGQAPVLTEISAAGEKIQLALQSPDDSPGLEDTGDAEQFTWTSRDGLEMQGWLIRPHGLKGPAPMVMDIHGGPIWACRNRWMGRLRGAKALCDRGVVSFYPNPRGSSCRGQEFAAKVRGDMGGEDTYDYLSGIDALVEQGIADPAKLGVTGISYGGFMSCWLITQDSRFAAAVPISPVSNWYSQHRTSQIPFFDEYFLDGSASEANGKFFNRSPVMFADRVQCPVLQLTGAKDQNTPPTQALEFHRSLLENGVTSVLATYPTAGHGIRSFPEVIDHTTRYVGWFLEHLGVASTD